MSDIKIFVSHRIDLNSELVDNPIYCPVRCGAVYDDVHLMDIYGDDTGDNISDKRMSYCEFTVQYWAWKNISADYYGMCHYRRYLSFAKKVFRADRNGIVLSDMLTDISKKRYGMLDNERMKEIISVNDIVTSCAADVRKMDTPVGQVNTVRELWDAQHGRQIDKDIIDVMFGLIDELSPEYSASAREYFNGSEHRGYNCFVMRRELFDKLCSFQFPILARIAEVDMNGYTDDMKRAPGYVGEMLYGIFVYHAEKYLGAKVDKRQLVLFLRTDKNGGRLKVYAKYTVIGIGKCIRAIVDPILPMGSKRREKLKDIYYGVIGEKHRRK